MGILIGAIITVVAGLGLAGGGTYVLVETSGPDSNVVFQDAPPANNTNGIVDYGRP